MSDKCPGCGAALGPMSSTRVVGACPSCGKNIWCYRVCGFLKVAIDHRDARIAELEALVAMWPKDIWGKPVGLDDELWTVHCGIPTEVRIRLMPIDALWGNDSPKAFALMPDDEEDEEEREGLHVLYRSRDEAAEAAKEATDGQSDDNGH